jgi:hypothetical protein
VRRWWGAPALALVAVAAACAPPVTAPGPATPTPAFGVLGSTCEPDRLAELRAAGVGVVELPLAWDRLQPEADVIDEDYAAQAGERIRACADAGMRIVLSPGRSTHPRGCASCRAGPRGAARAAARTASTSSSARPCGTRPPTTSTGSPPTSGSTA